MICFAKLPVSFDASEAQKELAHLHENWIAHFNTTNYSGGWDAIALRSPGGSHEQIIPDNTHNLLYTDTVLMQQLPTLQKITESLQCEKLSARLLNLRKGAVIHEHRDNELAFERGEARLHFPVITNAKVEFLVEKEPVVMQEGECWYINANLPHAVANRGDTDRIHFVVDCVVNDWLKNLFISAGKKTRVDTFTVEQNRQAIKELLSQNTEMSRALAAKLQEKINSELQ